jgi:endonuclease-3
MATRKTANAGKAPKRSKIRKKGARFDKAAAARRVEQIWPILRKTYPDAKVALHFSNPLELLVATILSAQCTDVRVNMVTKDLFKKYRSAADWAGATQEQIEEDVKTMGFFHNKATSIRAACQKLVEDYGGEVPDSMEKLVGLPGVGRKTANIVLGDAFGVPGIICDTHFIRLSRRLALSDNTDPVKLARSVR